MSSPSVTITGAGIREPAHNAQSQTGVQGPDALIAIAAAREATVVTDRPAVSPQSTRLSVELDRETSRYIFKSVDPDTGNVVHQYPTEQMLSLFAHVRQITGQTVDKSA